MRTCKRCEGQCTSYYTLNDPHIYWTTLCEGCYGIVVNTWPGFKGRYDLKVAKAAGNN
jgi:hypothetical protein